MLVAVCACVANSFVVVWCFALVMPVTLTFIEECQFWDYLSKFNLYAKVLLSFHKRHKTLSNLLVVVYATSLFKVLVI